MTEKTKIKDLFFKAIDSSGLVVPESSFNLLIEHYLLLEKWNSTFNLTSLPNPEDIIDRLYIDSLLFHKDIPDENPEMYDFGSGPGFPGIPLLSIRPKTKLIIVEPKQKMVSFLSEVEHAFQGQLAFQVIKARCDDPSFLDLHRNRISLAVSKALAPPDRAIQLLTPLLKPNGLYITGVNVGTPIKCDPDSPMPLKYEHTYTLPLTAKTTRHLIFQYKPSI